MAITDTEKNDDVRFIFGELFKEYGWSLSKLQLCSVIGCGTTQINSMIKQKSCPRYIKSGDSKSSAIMFPTYFVAKYLCENRTMNDYMDQNASKMIVQ